MTKQYHLWPADAGSGAGGCRPAGQPEPGLPVPAVTADPVREAGTAGWFGGSTIAAAVRAAVEHARLMLDADASFPVIPGPHGG
jgi:hypothetical protein